MTQNFCRGCGIELHSQVPGGYCIDCKSPLGKVLKAALVPESTLTRVQQIRKLMEAIETRDELAAAITEVGMAALAVLLDARRGGAPTHELDQMRLAVDHILAAAAAIRRVP